MAQSIERVAVELPTWLKPAQLLAAQSLFRDAADEDYIVARLSWKHRIARQFFWSASQAVEKYLKAAFLCNNMAARFGHEWFQEYEKLDQFATGAGYRSLAQLYPEDIAAIEACGWSERAYKEETPSFLSRVCESGRASVRYNEFAWMDVEPYDLHKLDTVVRWLRGLCFPLEGQITQDSSQSGPPDPSLLDMQRLADRHPVVTSSNFAFFPNQAVNPILWMGATASPVAVLILSDDAETIDWLKSNTWLNRSYSAIREQVGDARREVQDSSDW